MTEDQEETINVYYVARYSGDKVDVKLVLEVGRPSGYSGYDGFTKSEMGVRTLIWSLLPKTSFPYGYAGEAPTDRFKSSDGTHHHFYEGRGILGSDLRALIAGLGGQAEIDELDDLRKLVEIKMPFGMEDRRCIQREGYSLVNYE